MDELREMLARETGAEPPELIKLRRVTWGSAIQAALLVLAATALIGGLSNLDLATVVDQWRDAAWWWIAAAFVLAQTPRFTQAITTLGSVAAALPYMPVYVMQLATGFMNLALPSSIARMAINVRFFQRQGVPPAAAVTAGVIDSFAGNAVQLLLLILMLLFSQSAVDLNANIGTGGSGGHLIAALLVMLIVGAVALVTIGRVRRDRGAGTPLVARRSRRRGLDSGITQTGLPGRRRGRDRAALRGGPGSLRSGVRLRLRVCRRRRAV